MNRPVTTRLHLSLCLAAGVPAVEVAFSPPAFCQPLRMSSTAAMLGSGPSALCRPQPESAAQAATAINGIQRFIRLLIIIILTRPLRYKPLRALFIELLRAQLDVAQVCGFL